MKTISYRGLPFDWVQTLEQRWTPVMSDDGQDYLCSRLDLIVLVTLNPQAASFAINPGGTPAAQPGRLATLTESAIRHILAQPRGTLVVTTYDGTEVIRSPSNTSAGTPASTDVRGGPYCEVLGSPIMHSDRTWEWKLHFVTYMRECAQPRIFLSHRIQQTADVNELGFTDIYTNGKIEVDLGQLQNTGESIDEFRRHLFFPLPRGFQRKARVTQSSNGRQLEYTVIDSQAAIGYNTTIAQKIEAWQDSGWSSPHLLSPFSLESISQHSSDFRRTGVNAISIGKAAIDIAGRIIPHFTFRVIVRCWGSPTSSRNRLTALALAIAFARMGNPESTASTDIRVVEELTGKFSSVEYSSILSISQLVGVDTSKIGAIGNVITRQGLATTGVGWFGTFSPDAAMRASVSRFTENESFSADSPPTATIIAPGTPLPPLPGDSGCRGTWLVDLTYSLLLAPCQGPLRSVPVSEDEPYEQDPSAPALP